jgi:hypothetical protein
METAGWGASNLPFPQKKKLILAPTESAGFSVGKAKTPALYGAALGFRVPQGPRHLPAVLPYVS